MIIGAFLILASVIGVIAYTQSIPNPGHGADTVWVDVNGQEMTLQNAISSGAIGSGEIVRIYCAKAKSTRYITNQIVDRPVEATCPDGTSLLYHSIDYAYEYNTDWNDWQDARVSVDGNYLTNTINCSVSANLGHGAVGGIGLCR